MSGRRKPPPDYDEDWDKAEKEIEERERQPESGDLLRETYDTPGQAIGQVGEEPEVVGEAKTKDKTLIAQATRTPSTSTT